MTTCYKTNKHSKNKSIEERLERAVDALGSRVEFFDPDRDYFVFSDNNIADAENLNVAYERVCNCIQMLERFRTWLDHQTAN